MLENYSNHGMARQLGSSQRKVDGTVRTITLRTYLFFTYFTWYYLLATFVSLEVLIMNIHTYIYNYIYIYITYIYILQYVTIIYVIIHNILALLFNHAWALLVGRRLLLRTPAGHQTPSLGIQGAKQPFPAHSAGPKRRPGSWSGHGNS